MTSLAERIGVAPASWGICEVPGWGRQLSPERVLAEMREAGVAATELGPDGFLPGPPHEQAELLRAFDLAAIAAFCPIVLFDASRPPDDEVQRILDRFAALDVDLMVISADSGVTGYDVRPQLDEQQWKVFFDTLERVTAAAAEQGVRTCVHPHMGTLVEQPAEVARVLASCDLPLCLDTGHLLIGGNDPVALAAEVPERILHVHLKDVDADLLGSVRSGQRAYTDAVRSGMYRPLGRGCVDIAAIIRSLEAAGYRGWYVQEQDRVLAGEPGEDDGPLPSVRESIAFLRETVDRLAGVTPP